jgi:predicted nucleic-acid-binding protein
MIGLDTNILLRLWLDDDPAQGRRVDRLLAEHGTTPASLLVTDVVLAEATWTLASAYAQDKPALVQAVRSLLDETAFAFEDRDAVTRALALFEQASCGFTDCLVAAKHATNGCDFTATLDRRMRKLPSVQVL